MLPMCRWLGVVGLDLRSLLWVPFQKSSSIAGMVHKPQLALIIPTIILLIRVFVSLRFYGCSLLTEWYAVTVRACGFNEEAIV